MVNTYNMSQPLKNIKMIFKEKKTFETTIIRQVDHLNILHYEKSKL